MRKNQKDLVNYMYIPVPKEFVRKIDILKVAQNKKNRQEVLLDLLPGDEEDLFKENKKKRLSLEFPKLRFP